MRPPGRMVYRSKCVTERTELSLEFHFDLDREAFSAKLSDIGYCQGNQRKEIHKKLLTYVNTPAFLRKQDIN